MNVVSPEGWSSTRGGSSTIGVVGLWHLGDTVGSDDPVDMGLGVERIAGSVGRGGGDGCLSFGVVYELVGPLLGSLAC